MLSFRIHGRVKELLRSVLLANTVCLLFEASVLIELVICEHILHVLPVEGYHGHCLSEA